MPERKKTDIVSLVYGKLAPHAMPIEEKILGIMMYEFHHINEIKSILNAEDFYSESHKEIFKAALDISQTSKPDISLVVQLLKERDKLEEIGGAFYVAKLIQSVTGGENIARLCAIVKEKSVQRKLIIFSGDVLTKAYEGNEDIFGLLEDAEAKLKGISSELSELNITHVSETIMNVIEEFETRVYNARNDIVDDSLIYTGIPEWDKINGSLFPGLYVVAGRPGMGKGVHMVEMISRMAKKTPVGIINGEMTDEQLVKRIGCNLKGINNFLFKKNPINITDEEQDMLREAMEMVMQLKLKIFGNRQIGKIASKIRTWVEKDGVKCILADFLTLFKIPKELERNYTNQTLRVDYILDVFTSLCKDLKVPIILYVQMNREILGRSGTKEPNLADLKASGSIEELAYQVSFLHRPEYYDANAIVDDMGESTKGLMYQIIAKHREGELGRIKLRADMPCSKLSSWESNEGFKKIDLGETPF